ncbi:MAG: DUF5320 domain-containing protein [Syntrophobacteraceae bacterium]
MPGFDRTGPSGRGPMTGGMRGACTGFGRGGRGFGNVGLMAGTGRGRGWRNRFFSTGLTGRQSPEGMVFDRGPQRSDADYDLESDPQTHLDSLKARAGYLEKALEGIKKSIEKLQSGS